MAPAPEKVEAMLVDAPNVTAAQGHAVPVEEFEDLDRNLAPVVDAIAKLRRTELAIGRVCADVDDNVDHFRDSAAQKEMVVRDLVDLSHPAKQLQ